MFTIRRRLVKGSRHTQDPQDYPTSPRSPGGGRLAEKLKELKLGTSVGDLCARPPGKISMISLSGRMLIGEKIDTGDTMQSHYAWIPLPFPRSLLDP
jgi:hypothetical protein